MGFEDVEVGENSVHDDYDNDDVDDEVTDDGLGPKCAGNRKLQSRV